MIQPEKTFYVTGGTLRQDAACYIERQADRDLLDGLLRGEFCYVLTSRQMGKSSLMVRTAGKLRERGTSVVVLDLTALGQNVTPEQWYDGMLTRMGSQLRLQDELEDFWRKNQRLSPVQRFFGALSDVVLPNIRGKLVIFVDETDTVRSLSFSSDEFFAAIREYYNRRAEDPEFARVTFCLLGVATPSDLIRDTRLTPFNIGRRIELNDFTPEEAAPLARGLNADGAQRDPRQTLNRVLYWTQGHPYLTQRLCRAIAEDRAGFTLRDVDAACENAFLSPRARERDDNLIFVRERLLNTDVDRATLLDFYARVWKGKDVADDDANPPVTALKLSGVVSPDEGRLKSRNRIYHRVFNRTWIISNLPESELRRQRAAYRRGAIGVAAALIVVTVLLRLPVFRQSAASDPRIVAGYKPVTLPTDRAGLIKHGDDSLPPVTIHGFTNAVQFAADGSALTNQTAINKPVPGGVSAREPATILTVEGKVEFSPAGSTVWYSMNAGQCLYPGDALRTGPRSRATIRTADGPVVRIGELTHLRLEGKQSGWEILKGSIQRFLPRSTNAIATFEIRG